MDKRILIVIKTEIGVEYSPQFQKIISLYASAIKNRISLHDSDNLRPIDNSLIILEVIDNIVIKFLKSDIETLKDTYDNIKVKMIKI